MRHTNKKFSRSAKITRFSQLSFEASLQLAHRWFMAKKYGCTAEYLRLQTQHPELSSLVDQKAILGVLHQLYWRSASKPCTLRMGATNDDFFQNH